MSEHEPVSVREANVVDEEREFELRAPLDVPLKAAVDEAQMRDAHVGRQQPIEPDHHRAGILGRIVGIKRALSHQLALSLAIIPAVLPHVKAGKMRGLAVTALQRSPLAPEVPSVFCITQAMPLTTTCMIPR